MHALYTYMRPLCHTTSRLCLHGPFTGSDAFSDNLTEIVGFLFCWFLVLFLSPITRRWRMAEKKQCDRKWRYFAHIPGGTFLDKSKKKVSHLTITGHDARKHEAIVPASWSYFTALSNILKTKCLRKWRPFSNLCLQNAPYVYTSLFFCWWASRNIFKT